MKTIFFRKPEEKDIPLLMDLRKKQLLDEGITPTVSIDGYLQGMFAQERIIQFLGEQDGNTVCTGALVIMDFPPAWTNPTGQKGYITNMYTIPDFRRQGLAGQVLELLKTEAAQGDIFRLWLGASKLGRPVSGRPESGWIWI